MTNMSRMRFVRIVFHNIHFIVLFDFESPFDSINLNASAFDRVQSFQIVYNMCIILLDVCVIKSYEFNYRLKK